MSSTPPQKISSSSSTATTTTTALQQLSSSTTTTTTEPEIRRLHRQTLENEIEAEKKLHDNLSDKSDVIAPFIKFFPWIAQGTFDTISTRQFQRFLNRNHERDCLMALFESNQFTFDQMRKLTEYFNAVVYDFSLTDYEVFQIRLTLLKILYVKSLLFISIDFLPLIGTEIAKKEYFDHINGHSSNRTRPVSYTTLDLSTFDLAFFQYMSDEKKSTYDTTIHPLDAYYWISPCGKVGVRERILLTFLSAESQYEDNLLKRVLKHDLCESKLFPLILDYVYPKKDILLVVNEPLSSTVKNVPAHHLVAVNDRDKETVTVYGPNTCSSHSLTSTSTISNMFLFLKEEAEYDNKNLIKQLTLLHKRAINETTSTAQEKKEEKEEKQDKEKELYRTVVEWIIIAHETSLSNDFSVLASIARRWSNFPIYTKDDLNTNPQKVFKCILEHASENDSNRTRKVLTSIINREYHAYFTTRNGYDTASFDDLLRYAGNIIPPNFLLRVVTSDYTPKMLLAAAQFLEKIVKQLLARETRRLVSDEDIATDFIVKIKLNRQ